MSTCACPKCEAVIEVEIDDITNAAASQQCPKCNVKFWTQREEFTLRPYKKKGKIYCFGCGHELGHDDLCQRCGRLFPDYFVVQTAKPVQRKQQKKSFSFSSRPAREPVEEVTFEEVAFEEAAEPRQRTNFKPLAYVALVVLLLVLVGGIGQYYLQQQAKKQYSRNFIVALYGLKSATDLCLGNSAKISSDWKASGQAIAPRLSTEQLTRLETVKVAIDEALEKLTETPEEFAASRQQLTKLYQVYLQLKSLNESSPDSLEELSANVAKLDKDFIAAAKQLKNGFPDMLLDELTASVGKYRNLRFMVN